MSDVIVSAEHLSKCFRIGNTEQPRMATFRDLIVDTAGRVKNRILHPLAGGSDDLVDFWALKDVSFELRAGDRLGVIGHNGSGKSTLLKILSRITEPTSG